MVRRFKPTLFDYMVIAINPALIMMLIGSLIYFLLEMFYQGQYPGRLHYCLTLFIFAAVLVSRISMEEGWDHAAPFGAALAIVICLAMHRFVSYDGSRFETIGWLINYGLIAIIWWCAIQLTWDCTLIDETQDASGEGLLQAVGLDRESRGDQAETDVAEKTNETAGSESTKPRPVVAPAEAEKKAHGQPTDRPFDDDMAWSTEKKPAKKPAKKSSDEKSWWDKFLERRRRPHAPGVWVVYFSLAALPIFGIGQVFIPTTNTGSRRYTFVLLCVYVATGLGLLMTTSFLGLRRYLRQRRLEMPLAMANTWLITGTVLIICLLVITMLLPRPNAEYAISQMPLAAGSTEHDSSRMAVGKEGTRDDQAKNASGERSRPENDEQASEQKQSGSGTSSTSKNQSGAPANGESKLAGGKSGDGKKGDSQSGKSDGGSGKSEASKESQSTASSGEKAKSSQAQSSSENQSSAEKSNSSQTAQSQNLQEQKSDQSKQESSQSQGETSPPETPSTPDVSFVSDSLAALFKWIFYGAVILTAAWWAWQHREELLAWLLAFLTGWRDLWGLLGRRRDRKQAEVIPPAPRHKSFYDYTDPFASGQAGQFSPAELVRYTFEAFEAWARDNGWPRDADQTAYEFARKVGGHAEEVAKPARALAELYSRAAYAPGTLPAASVEHLRSLWQTLRERQPVGY
ncbi:MAG TPA: DUF4129 domain-containing protein [Pirellulales bacterium]|jgi:uncharacterized membrane protein YidH (DUF202 family)|nr:DUF4129 domain-containing protein [Pirellulales bacterium]